MVLGFENFDPCFPDQPVVDLYLPVWANLPAFWSKPAFIWAEDGSDDALTRGSFLTYGQLHDSVQLISEQLLARLRRRDTVVILCSPGLELVELIFGCQRAGLLSVPICPPDPCFTREDYHHLARALSQTKPTAAIAHRAYITSVCQHLSSTPNDKKLALMLQSVQWISTDDIKCKKVNSNYSKFSYISYRGCKPEEAYLVQYTSGTTGIPKPVVVSAGSAAHNVRAARKAYDLHPNSVIVSWLPQYHDCGLMFLLLTVVCGATCALTSPRCFANQPMTWLQLVSEFKATCTPVPSFTLPLVVKRRGAAKETSSVTLNLCSLENLILINEPIYRSSVEEFVDLFRPFGLNPSCISPSYGLAENCTFVSTSWRSSTKGSFPDMPTHNKLLPSARLADSAERDGEEMEEIEILVVNEETHEPVDDGIEGEIWVSSPGNASGYLGHPSLTREALHARLSNKTSHRFVRTGDRGVVKGEDRYLFVIGRCADIIKLPNNQAIHPHHIETAAYDSCPHLLRGGCLAAVKVSETVAVIAEMQKTGEEVEALRKICEGIKKAALMEEGVEVGLVILVKKGSIPKTTSGKIKRWAAKDKLLGGGMNIIMGARFGKTGGVLKPLKMTADQERKEDLVSGEKKEDLPPFSSFPIRPLLLSLL